MPSTTTWKRLTGMGGFMITTLFPSTQAAFMPVIRQAANISWFACPDSDTTQCAFFDVPMDYSNPDNNATMSIFMRKLPAKVPAEQRLGTILTNPGGPGGSGSLFIEAGGEELSTIVEGRYDIIGFDPRGVNLTGPPTACFDVESKFVNQAYQVQQHGAPFPHLDKNAERAHVAKLAAIQASHPAACAQNGNHQVLQSVGTVAVAHDMARIVEALGEDGLNYWGYSYGTILGATFAALHPELVKRMVLDGVSDAESYFDDPLQWGRDGMQETHKTFEGFLSTCIEAAPGKCAFAAPKDGSNRNETVASLRKRLDAIYSRLSDQPLTVADSLAGPGVLKASDIQLGLLNILYTPKYWSDMAELLVELEQGVGSNAYTALYYSFYNIQPRPYNENVYNRSMQVYTNTRESIFSIFCGDSSPLNISVDAYVDYLRELGKVSPVGEQWGVIVGGCRRWPFQAKQRYTGPWTTADGLKKTKFPILFLSLDADPVTPLASAVKMNRGFGKESSSLLIQQGYGHCTTAHPSLCTAKNVRDYFVDGKVPANGTHCTPEPGFIYPDNSTSTSTKRGVRQLSKRDEDLLGALDRLHHARSGFLRHGFSGVYRANSRSL